jgi:hypothetical protein
MKNKVTALLVILLFVGVSSLARAKSPLIVAKRKYTSVGTFVIYVPATNGNFRATVYLESPAGNEPTCASMSWSDDYNPQTSANICSDNSAKGGFVLPIHAKGGTNIYLNFNSGPGPVYTTLEKF